MSTGATNDWLSGVLGDEVPVRAREGAAAAASSAGVNKLVITGRVPVSQGDLALIDAAGRDAQRFTLEYKLATPVTFVQLGAMPVIVDADADTFKLSDRAGVRNVRVNGRKVADNSWAVLRWRPELALMNGGAWLWDHGTLQHDQLRNMFRVKVGEEELVVLKHELVDEGRALRVLSVDDEGKTSERLIPVKGGVSLDNLSHAFRHAFKEASSHAFMLSMGNLGDEKIESFSYDLETSGLGLGLELENTAGVQSNSAYFNLVVHATRPSVLAPAMLQNLLRCTPTRVRVTGTTGYHRAPVVRFAQTEVQYAKARSVSQADSSYASSVQRGATATVFSRKRPGAKFESEPQGGFVHARVPVRAFMRAPFRLKPHSQLTVVYQVADEERFPTSPALILWGVNAVPEEKGADVRSFIDTLPPNLRLRHAIQGQDEIEADLDTDTVHIFKERGDARLAAYVDSYSILDTVVPGVRLRATKVEDDMRTMTIEVTPGSDIRVCILFSSARYTMAKILDETDANTGDRRDPAWIFMGGRAAHFETSTIRDAVFIDSDPARSKVFDVMTVTTTVRK